MTSLFAIARFSLMDLKARLLRAILTSLGIMIAVGMYVTVESAVAAFERALVNNVAAVQAHLEITETDTLDFLSSIVPEDLEARISGDPSVGRSAPMLVRLLSIVPGYSVPVLGWTETSFLWDSIEIVDGRKPRQASEPEVAIGISLAKKLKAAPGRRLRLGGERIVTVVGIFDTPSQINRTAVVSILTDLQVISNRPRQATSIAIKLKPEALTNVEATRARIAALVPEFHVVNTETLARENVLLVMTRAFASAMQVVVLLLAFFASANTVWTAVRERRHDFAIMRVFGWPLSRLAVFIGVQSLVLTSAGFIGGTLIGVAGAYALGSIGPTAAFLEPQIEPWKLVWAAGAAFGVSFFATALPVWSISRTEATVVLRNA